eukprot:3068154-Amphidinium_carterae.1
MELVVTLAAMSLSTVAVHTTLCYVLAMSLSLLLALPAKNHTTRARELSPAKRTISPTRLRKKKSSIYWCTLFVPGIRAGGQNKYCLYCYEFTAQLHSCFGYWFVDSFETYVVGENWCYTFVAAPRLQL